MLVENPEALKSWLVVILEPLCDADSSALARYVLALLKKEKPEKELKKVMIEQLDVFLGDETTPFVDKLFDAINSKKYLIPLPPSLSGSIKTEDSELEAAGSDDANIESAPIKTENGHETSSSDMKIASTSSFALSTNSAVSVKTEKSNHATSSSEPKTKETHQSSQKSNEQPNSASASAENRSSHQSTHSPAVQRGETAQSHAQQQSSHHHSHHHSSTSSNSHVRSASPPARTNADKENQPRDSRRRRASLRSRSRSPRSRSRSNERFSHNASRDRRANDREKNHRQFRNKSPPPSGVDGRHANDRRRISGDIRRRLGGGGGGSGGSGRSGNNTDDRSPRFSGAGTSNTETAERKPPRNINAAARSHSRSRSPSAERTAGRTGKTSPNNNVNRQLVRRSSTERHRSSQNLEMVPSEKRQRCVDFEEKGYCMRGETCPWDHGINPVVFEGVNNTSLLNMSLREYNPDVPELWATGRSAPPAGGMLGSTVHVVPGSINPFTGAVRPNAAAAGAIMAAGPNNAVEYIRGTTVISAGNVAFRGAAPMLPFGFNPPGGMQSHLQRELIPVPVLDAGGAGNQVEMSVGGSKRRYDAEDVSNVSADGPPKRKPPINSRLGPRVNSVQNNCSLELRKVPRGLNTITHLNNHFTKFGKIVNIQISYDGDPEAAIITFSTHAEANVAYRSTEAVLNNRFIKVFWHNQDNIVSSSIAPAGSSDGINRKSSHYHLNKTPAAVSTTSANTADVATKAAGNTSATLGEAASTNSESAATPSEGNENPNTALAASTQPSLRLKNNVPQRAANAAIIRKKQEEQAKAVVHLANGLRKRKQELLQSYLKQMKSAVELVERCEPNDPQRTNTLETIKVLQETIDKLRKEIAAEQEQVQAQIQSQQPPVVAVAPTIKKTKEQQKKELLDIELELFAQQQEGNDTTAIQKRLEELQRSLGITPGSAGPASGAGKPHFAGMRSVARVRPTLPEGSTRVDRRPKTIVVTGFTSDEADFVLGHFKNFGEITKHDMDREIPQLILSYATRISAEQAVVRGKLFKDKRLQISWAPVVSQTTKPTAVAGDKIVQNEKMLVCGEMAKINAAADVEAKDLKSPTGKDTLPELRLEDEEEEDENEDRSWRR